MRLPALFCLAMLFTACASSTQTSLSPAITATPLQSAPFEIARQFGGTHHQLLIRDSHWFQLFNSSLLVLDPATAVPIASLPLTSDPSLSASAVDLLIHQDHLFITLQDRAVVELDLAASPPAILHTFTADQLHVDPRVLSVAGNQIYVSGLGGIIRLSDNVNVLPSPDQSPGPVISVGSDLFTTLGRRIFRVADHKYLGSASKLLPLPDPPQLDSRAAFLFVRQSDSDFELGLMSADCREITPPLKIPGEFRSLHDAPSSNLWLTTSAAIHHISIASDHLECLDSNEFTDVFDAAPLSENRLAIAGAFGRAILPVPDSNHSLNLDSGLALFREPSHVTGAIAEERSILLATPAGTFRWSLADPSVQFLSANPQTLPPAALRAATVRATVSIPDDHTQLIFTSPSFDAFRWTHPANATLNSVIAVNGDFYVGHSLGVSVLRVASPSPASSPAQLRLVAEISCPSPVTFLFPPRLAGGGVAFVSEDAGLGVIQQHHP